MSLITHNKNHSVWILWGEEPINDNGPHIYQFKTEEELDAFLTGVEEAQGWFGYGAIIQKEEPELKEFDNYSEE